MLESVFDYLCDRDYVTKREALGRVWYALRKDRLECLDRLAGAAYTRDEAVLNSLHKSVKAERFGALQPDLNKVKSEGTIC